MKKPHAPAVREYLRQHEDGATVDQIRKALGIGKNETTRNVLEAMPDAYIDRWVTPVRGQWQSVWCAVTPPENCPYPTARFEAKTKWIEVRV